MNTVKKLFAFTLLGTLLLNPFCAFAGHCNASYKNAQQEEQSDTANETYFNTGNAILVAAGAVILYGIITLAAGIAEEMQQTVETVATEPVSEALDTVTEAVQGAVEKVTEAVQTVQSAVEQA